MGWRDLLIVVNDVKQEGQGREEKAKRCAVGTCQGAHGHAAPTAHELSQQRCGILQQVCTMVLVECHVQSLTVAATHTVAPPQGHSVHNRHHNGGGGGWRTGMGGRGRGGGGGTG